MRRTVQALLLAAVTCVAMFTFASPANAQTGGDDEPRFRALIFGKTAAFRHTECIPSGTVAIAQMAVRNNFEVDATENAADFTAANLARYDVVIFLCTTGDVLNAAQQTAFEGYIRAGGGYAGIHSASDTEYDWPFYGGLVGAYFRDHPGVAGVNSQFQRATVRVEDRGTAATEDLPRSWVREDEWYNFRTNPRDDVHVLMSLDESTYDPRGYSVPGGSPPMGDHPISWCQRYEGGRSFYTALGHRGVYWSEPLLLAHVLGGIEMAAGVADFDCGRRSGEELRRLVRQITRDCSRDDDLDRQYPLRALRRALRDLPDDVAETTRCERVIERAIRRLENQRGREVERILRDCSRDDDLDRLYSRRALRIALRTMPDDVRNYTDCEDAIRDALPDR
jgi:type 1 glutamine amidotransferase